MTLAAFQNRFADYLRRRSDDVRSQVRGGPHESVDTMLGIYRNAYTIRLVKILRGDFSRLHRLVGDATFDRIAEDYLDARPSRSFSVRWVGAGLADFIAAHEIGLRNPELAQLARLEWAQIMAFDAADAPLARRDDLASVAPADWPNLVLVPHASVRVLTISPDVFALWQTLGDNQPVGSRPASFAADAPHLVWRLGLDVKLRALEPDEADAFAAAIAGENFATICERLAGFVGDDRAALRAVELLARWIDAGMIGRVEPSPTQSR
jgi:hypothetical protein